MADPSVFFWIKCGAALALFVAQNVSPAKVIRLGTILKSAKKFVSYITRFKRAKDAASHFAALLGSATGVNDVVHRCWP